MAGGHATQKGIRFQNQVAAWIATHIIAGKPLTEISDDNHIIPVSFFLETITPVDDIVVKTSNEGNIYINVKTRLSVSREIKSDLSNVIGQFVRQWIYRPSSFRVYPTKDHFDDSIDRLALVLNSAENSEFCNSLNTVLQRVRDRKSILPINEIATTARQLEIFESCKFLMTHHWKQQVGGELSDATLLSLFSAIRVLGFSLEGTTKHSLEILISDAVTKSDPGSVLEALLDIVAELSEKRSGTDAAGLRERLRNKKIIVEDEPKYKNDLERLFQYTNATLSTLGHYGSIQTTNNNGDPVHIVIDRPCTHALIEAAKVSSFLLVGDPGAGKSGSLHQAAKTLIEDQYNVIVLAVDQLRAGSLFELKQELELNHPILDVLVSHHPNNPPLLFIDALDASRGGPSERAILDLIHGLKQKGPQWNVIASIRKFDLRFGNNYQNLFIGKAVNDQFIDSEFRSVNHLNIPNLTETEINWICNRWERLMSIYSKAGEQFRALLKSPFNLHLLSKVFYTSSNEDLGHAKTQLELLQKYWQHWVVGNSATEGKRHMRVLSLLMDSMIEEHSLYSDESLIDTTLIADLNLLLSKGVLYQSTGTTRITFSHHVLFDFALAKIKLLNEGSVNLLNELTTSDDDTLLIAPASMLALRVIWDEDNQRNHFWDIAFNLATAKNFGAFSRSLPARIIAEATSQLSDVARLIEGIRSHDDGIREAALFLTRHIYGVLISRVIKNIPNLDNPSDPWPEITQQICESSIALVVWPMKAVVADWTGKGRTFSTNHLNPLGKCSRLLLDQCLLMENYDEGAISAAISGVIATFESDVTESVQVLGMLLEPQRVAQYGHRELFWFALGFDAIANLSPTLAANLLLCVYTTPLPSQDEKTSLSNSQILELISNKKQDFEGVRYQLEDKISLFLLEHKEEASAVVKQILWYLGQEDKKENTESNKVTLRQSEFLMYTDYNTIWWKGEEHEYDTRGNILTQLLKALTQPSAESPGTELLKYANYFLTGDIHTGIVTAFMKALQNTQYPECFDLVEDLLSSLPILTNLDTYYLAGTLITKYYPLLSSRARESIEQTIKLIPDEQSKFIVIGCLVPSLIVDSSLAKIHQELTKQNKIIPNSPPFQLESFWGSSDENWWLKREGVNIEGHIEKSVLEAISDINSTSVDNSKTNEWDSNAERWDKVQHLCFLLESNPELHILLQNKGWDAIAEACAKAAEHCSSSEDLSRFPQIRSFISLCLRPDLNPKAIHDSAAEINFEESASWGRPSPRIEAAEALMVYLRAKKTVAEEEYELVLSLARDQAVAVRHTILARSNVVSVASPNLSRALAEIAFGEEKNLGVIKFFLGSFHNYLNQDLTWASQKLLELDRRMEFQDETKSDDLSSQLVSLILHLWLVWSDENAEDRLYLWADSSIEYARRVGHLLVDLREFIVFGNLEEKIKREEVIRDKASKLFNRIVSNLSDSQHSLREKVIRENKSDPHYEISIRQLHIAANQLYFGSGAYKYSNDPSNQCHPAVGRRFLRDYGAALKKLARIPHPSVTHPVLETLKEFIQIDPTQTLELLFETLQVGGRKGQYAYESMGADLVVRLVQRFLADYPSLIANNLEYRKSLVEILDHFAEVGWPEARKLVYNLPEMLR